MLIVNHRCVLIFPCPGNLCHYRMNLLQCQWLTQQQDGGTGKLSFAHNFTMREELFHGPTIYLFCGNLRVMYLLKHDSSSSDSQFIKIINGGIRNQLGSPIGYWRLLTYLILLGLVQRLQTFTIASIGNPLPLHYDISRSSRHFK